MRALAPAAVLVLAIADAAAQSRQFELDTPAAIHAAAVQRTTTADVDGDGDLDVIGWSSISLTPIPLLLRNDGDGLFTDVTATQFPAAAFAFVVLPFDADGDGDPDLFVGGSSTTQVWTNDGTGVFAVHQTFAFPILYQTAAVAVDLDGDGDLDLALAGSALGGSSNRVLVNNGTGTFSPGPVFPTSLASCIASLDLDGDLDQDLVFADQPARLWRNDGNLQFTDVTASQLQVTSTMNFVWTATDVDGDGATDLVCSGLNVDAVLRNVNGVLIETTTLPSISQTDSLVVCDVDRDGRADLLRGNDQSGLELLLGLGGLAFAPAPQRLPPNTVWSTNLHLADFDRDGDPEILSCLAFAPTLLLQNRNLDLWTSPAQIGQPWLVQVTSQPGYATAPRLARLAVGLAPLAPPLGIPAFGLLHVDPTALVVLADVTLATPTGQFLLTLPVPNAPVLVGLQLYTQALVETADGPRLTNRRVTTIG